MKASSESGLWAQTISVLEVLGIEHRGLHNIAASVCRSWMRARRVLLGDQRVELDAEAIERRLEALEVRFHAAKVVVAALALEFEDGLEGGAGTEGRDRPFEAMGLALNALGVARGNGAAQIHECRRTFLEEEEANFAQEVHIPTDTGERRVAVEYWNRFLTAYHGFVLYIYSTEAG